MTVVETLPPEPNLLKFMLERRQPGKYRKTKEVVHTHNAGALFQRILERMDARDRRQASQGFRAADISSWNFRRSNGHLKSKRHYRLCRTPIGAKTRLDNTTTE